MLEKFLLGVDGGGTKTDYVLCHSNGQIMDHLRVGSRSHEVVEGGFLALERLVSKDIQTLLSKHQIAIGNVVAAFGLAGIDTLDQLYKVKNILDQFGFEGYEVANDSILGIKAGCPSGVGICNINGTGSVTLGIDQAGCMLQIGGVGQVTGDESGGIVLGMKAVKAVYDHFFRFGPATSLSKRIFSLLEISDPSELLGAISLKFLEDRRLDTQVIQALFEEGSLGDEVAQAIITHAATEIAKSVAGCIKHIGFKEVPEIVLAGSIWAKADNGLMFKTFIEVLEIYTGVKVDPYKLQVKPVAGAVIWAKECLEGHTPIDQGTRALIMGQC